MFFAGTQDVNKTSVGGSDFGDKTITETIGLSKHFPALVESKLVCNPNYFVAGINVGRVGEKAGSSDGEKYK